MRAVARLWPLVVLPLMVAAGAVAALSLALARDGHPATAGAPSIALVPPSSVATPGAVVVQPSLELLPPSAGVLLAPPTPAVLEARVRDAILAALGDAYAGHQSVVVVRPADGLRVEVGGDQVYYAASTFKLAVLYEALQRRSAGRLAFDDPLVLSDEDIAEDLGTLGEVAPTDGTPLTIGACVRAMIVISDNACAVALMRRFGEDEINATLRGLGLESTLLNTSDLPTTAADMARLMEALVRGDGLDDDGRRDARDLLLAQASRSGIPAGIPAGIAVGNKTGTYPGATHDVAFVEAPSGTYVIAVLTEGDWDWAPIAAVSEAVFRALEGDDEPAPGK